MIAKVSKDLSALIAFDEGEKYTFRLICTREVKGRRTTTSEAGTTCEYTVLFRLALKTKDIRQRHKLNIAKRLGAWMESQNIPIGEFALVDGDIEQDYEDIVRELLLDPNLEDDIWEEFSFEEKAHLRELKMKFILRRNP